jgi:O-antigen ligase
MRRQGVLAPIAAIVLAVAALLGLSIAFGGETAFVGVRHQLDELVGKGAVESFENRRLWWRVALDEIAAHPVLGAGPGSFERQVSESPRLVAYLGHAPTAADSTHWKVGHPHSVYLCIAAELGLVGFALFLATLAFAFVDAWRRAAIEPLLAGLPAALAAWCVAGIFESLHLNGRTLGLFAALIALASLPRAAPRH